ncbi:MAG: 4Fe-4S dicluster domain-containing protein, partial [Desulfofustis sp.]|nr:4Fe-4S dicluster domain-containing protein [Desulfofustis sp.]
MTQSVNKQQSPKVTGAVLVIGGGIGGMQSSLDLAEAGFRVYLVESAPAIGGKMAQLDKTFPTNDCSMCIVSPKLVEVGRHRNIELLTHSEVLGLDGQAGNFTARIAQHARYVDTDKCTGCGLCELACPVTRISWFAEPPVPGEKKKRPKARDKTVLPGVAPKTAGGIAAWTFTVDTERCSRCGACFRACLHGAVSWQKKEIAAIDQDRCIGCGACYAACPEQFQAITIDQAPDLDKSLGAALYARSQEIIKQRGGRIRSECIRCGLCVL